MRPPRRGLKLKGWKYEQTAHELLEDRYGIDRYVPSLWFEFQTKYSRKGRQYCQTDGLIFEPEARRIVLIECKLRHTPQAYFQCENKYVPVLRKAFKDWTICVCEVVHWYDPHQSFPVPVRLVPEPLDLKPNEFGVHILNP